MQITGGVWRGRRLPSAGAGVRPTTARARGTLFSWIGPRLDGRRCLDLFAGSGCLSLEALSRGAERVTMLEVNAARCRQIRRNVALLGCGGRTQLLHSDSRLWLRRIRKPTEPWNLVFADPPYSSTTALERLHLLCDRNLVSADSLLYLETGSPDVQPPPPWKLERQARQSDQWLRLYRLDDPRQGGGS